MDAQRKVPWYKRSFLAPKPGEPTEAELEIPTVVVEKRLRKKRREPGDASSVGGSSSVDGHGHSSRIPETPTNDTVPRAVNHHHRNSLSPSTQYSAQFSSQSSSQRSHSSDNDLGPDRGRHFGLHSSPSLTSHPALPASHPFQPHNHFFPETRQQAVAASAQRR